MIIIIVSETEDINKNTANKVIKKGKSMRVNINITSFKILKVYKNPKDRAKLPRSILIR